MRFLTSRSGVQILPGAFIVMEISKISLSLAVYLALIESISLFVLDFSREFDFYGAFLVGFVPAIIVLVLYKLASTVFPVKLNNKSVSNVPIVFLSIANGLFIILLFLLQDFMNKLKLNMFVSLFGFFSVFLSFLILVLIYNKLDFKVEFNLENRLVKIKKVSLYFAVYAGIVEAFILPLMALFYSYGISSLLTGFAAGFVGGIIGLWVVDYIINKKPLELL